MWLPGVVFALVFICIIAKRFQAPTGVTSLA